MVMNKQSNNKNPFTFEVRQFAHNLVSSIQKEYNVTLKYARAQAIRLLQYAVDKKKGKITGSG